MLSPMHASLRQQANHTEALTTWRAREWQRLTQYQQTQRRPQDTATAQTQQRHGRLEAQAKQ
jgi:hypothetical protein